MVHGKLRKLDLFGGVTFLVTKFTRVLERLQGAQYTEPIGKNGEPRAKHPLQRAKQSTLPNAITCFGWLELPSK